MQKYIVLAGTLACASLGACSSLGGSPQLVPFLADNFRQNVSYDVSTAVNDFEFRLRDASATNAPAGHDPSDAKAYRNKVIAIYMTAIDMQYGVFRRKLNFQRKGFGLGLNLAAIGFSGAVPLVADGTKNVLGALASGAGSTRTSIDKELYFDQALPAIFAAMDAERAKAKATLLENMQKSASDYSMSQAFIDLFAYQAAPTFERAIDKLTAAANADLKAADTKLENAVAGCNVDEDLSTQRFKLMDIMRGSNVSDATLKRMALRTETDTKNNGVDLAPADLRSAIENRLRSRPCSAAQLDLLATDFANYVKEGAGQ